MAQCLARAGAVRTGVESLIDDRPVRRDDRIGGDRPLPSGYGAPTLLRPRLGQRSFRIAVLDAWGRRCTATDERSLPLPKRRTFVMAERR